LLLSLVVYGVQFLFLCHSVSLHLLIVLVQQGHLFPDAISFC
jgi:hypothetical protein